MRFVAARVVRIPFTGFLGVQAAIARQFGDHRGQGHMILPLDASATIGEFGEFGATVGSVWLAETAIGTEGLFRLTGFGRFRFSGDRGGLLNRGFVLR